MLKTLWCMLMHKGHRQKFNVKPSGVYSYTCLKCGESGVSISRKAS